MSSASKDARNALDLGHEFGDPALLARALTHSSFANESSESEADNEQLEFLGDSVLSLVTSEHLCRRFPAYSEGQLSKLRAHLVSARHLAKFGRTANLGHHLRLGIGEERSGGGQKQAVLADAVEAVIAAIYLDGGLDAARRFVLEKVIGPELARMGPDPAARTARTDFKSTLQEFLQSRGQAQPVYEVVEEAGPEHSKVFTIEVKLDSAEPVRAQGRSKKHAEQRAAELALERLRNMDVQVAP